MFGNECDGVLIVPQSFPPEPGWMIQAGSVILTEGKWTLLKRKKPQIPVLDHIRQRPFADEDCPARGINGSDHVFA